jgi:hypothetical protein
MGKVIPKQLPTGTDHADGLGERALPVANVMEHGEREHDIEGAIAVWKGRRVDPLYLRACTEPRERSPGRADHAIVVVSCGQS